MFSQAALRTLVFAPETLEGWNPLLYCRAERGKGLLLFLLRTIGRAPLLNICVQLDVTPSSLDTAGRDREFFIANLLVRIHLIIEIILEDRPRAMGVSIPFSR